MQNMTTKKKITYIVIALVFIIIMAIGTVLILGALNGKKTTDTSKTQAPVPTAKEAADIQMTQAVQSLHSDPVKAKELLTQLRQKYKDMGDTNSVVNVDAQLYLIDHLETTK